MTKVLIVGLDGGTFNLLKPWAERGILPNIGKLLRRGIHGQLESTVPPVTAPAWVSFATGAQPGTHGCFDFLLPKDSINKTFTITTSDICVPTFYEILEKKGLRCVIINLPVSYPPKIKGPTITSLLGRKDKFIFPGDLVEEVPNLKNYRIVPDLSLLVKKEINQYLEDIREVERTRFECGQELFRSEWDFFFILFGASDWIQHVFYHDLATGKLDENHPAVSIFKDMDDFIGWFIDNLPPETCLFVISDHGFKSYEAVFHVNEWLRREGYQTVRSSTQPTKGISMFDDELIKGTEKGLLNIPIPTFVTRLPGFLKLGGVYRRLEKVLPIIPKFSIEFDPSKTVAVSIASSSKSIIVNRKDRFSDGIVDSKDYEELRNEIIKKLTDLRDEQTGRKVFSKVLRREDVYTGSLLSVAPDILLFSETHKLVSGVFPACIERVVSNDHSSHGIFLAYGHGIRDDGSSLQRLRLIDVAPTILHIFGHPIPRTMDGEVLREIFAEGSKYLKRETVYEETSEEERVAQRIRDLKRIGKLR